MRSVSTVVRNSAIRCTTVSSRPTIVSLIRSLLRAAVHSTSTRPVPTSEQRRPAIVVASFDFPESELLAELYGQALRARGYPVELVARLGAREVVEPALEQGKVDLVPEYLGTALTFLDEGGLAPSADPRV